MRQLTLVAIAVAMAAGSAMAQTYRWVDPATGKTMITDTPPPGSVKNVNKTKDDSEDPNAALGPTVKRAMENFPVTLYTSSDCIDDCKQARELLSKRGIPFTEKVVQKREEIAELKALVGDAYVPTLKVGSQSLKGLQVDGYNNLLDLAGYPKTAPYGAKPPAAPAQ